MLAKINILHIVIALVASGCLLLALREVAGRPMKRLQLFAVPVLATLTALVMLLFVLREPLPRTIWGAALAAGLLTGAINGTNMALKVDQVRSRFRLPDGRHVLWVTLALVLAVALECSFALSGGIAFPYYMAPTAMASLCSGFLLGQALAVTVRIPGTPHDGR